MIPTATLPMGRSVRLAVRVAGLGSSFIRVSPSFGREAICPTGSAPLSNGSADLARSEGQAGGVRRTSWALCSTINEPSGSTVEGAERRRRRSSARWCRRATARAGCSPERRGSVSTHHHDSAVGSGRKSEAPGGRWFGRAAIPVPRDRTSIPASVAFAVGYGLVSVIGLPSRSTHGITAQRSAGHRSHSRRGLSLSGSRGGVAPGCPSTRVISAPEGATATMSRSTRSRCRQCRAARSPRGCCSRVADSPEAEQPRARYHAWLILVPGERPCPRVQGDQRAIGRHGHRRAAWHRDRAVTMTLRSHSIGGSSGRTTGSVDEATTVSAGVMTCGSSLDRTANVATATTAAAAARSPATRTRFGRFWCSSVGLGVSRSIMVVSSSLN